MLVGEREVAEVVQGGGEEEVGAGEEEGEVVVGWGI